MRRFADIVVSAAALAVLLPLLAVLCVAVMLDSPGSPIYGGRRVGRHGREFRMWKLRTMVKDADAAGPSVTGAVDSRVTRLGAFLRRTKLDELPQFFNVLIGQMTLVGPRAEAPDIVARYTPRQVELLRHKPGITGVGAIHFTTEQAGELPAGHSATDYYVERLLGEKLALEAQYEESRSPSSDVRLIWRTVALMASASWRGEKPRLS